MTTITINNKEVSASELSDIIGEQLILEGKHSAFSHLAGLCFDGIANGDSIENILIEYFENARAFEHLTDDDISELKTILTGRNELMNDILITYFKQSPMYDHLTDDDISKIESIIKNN